MRAVVLDVETTQFDELLAERTRLGLDGRDEMWDGELHVVPPANLRHQLFSTRLLLVLAQTRRVTGAPREPSSWSRSDHPGTRRW